MSERARPVQRIIRSPLDSSFDIDHRGNICYWNEGYRLIQPSMPIEDGELFIGKVGQQNILPNHLSLKPRDLCDTLVSTADSCPIGIVKAGLSGFLFFGDQSSRQDDRDTIVEDCVGKTPHKKTRVHVAQVKDILENGWIPYYAPLIDARYPIRNPLHIIMVPGSILESGVNQDATPAEKEALAKAFVRWSC